MIRANFTAYGSYVTDSVNQWDLNHTLRVSGLNLTSAPEVHFSNANVDRAIVRQSTMTDHVVEVSIPNSLLQDPLTIKAHIGVYEGDTFKVVELVEVPVKPRKRPADYQLEDTDGEVYSFKALENALTNRATNARVDNILAHNNDTDGNSELVDIRTDNAGRIYASAGAAVRSKVGPGVEYLSAANCAAKGITSVLDLPVNSLNTLMNDLTEEMVSGLPEYGKMATLIRFNPSPADHRANEFSVSLYINVAGEIWSAFGQSSTGLTEWRKLVDTKQADSQEANLLTQLERYITEQVSVQNQYNGFSAFSRFAVIGDSLSVGYYTDSEGAEHSTDYFHSWPAYAGRTSGATPHWCGMSGKTCQTWLEQTTGNWGLKYTQELGVMPLYVIAMGANEGNDAIGTAADIGTNAKTLYGYISKTVEALRAISPKSYIVCTGVSRGQGVDNPINDVYAEVCNHYDRCYYMDVEAELNSEPFTTHYFNWHYTAAGYAAMADLYGKKMAEIITNNPEDFRYINEADPTAD